MMKTSSQKPTPLSRRSFLKLLGTHMAALAIPVYAYDEMGERIAWPSLSIDLVPEAVQKILLKVPRTSISSDGYLALQGTDRRILGRVPFARTAWNTTWDRKHDRLYTYLPWGLVLHWYGDRENFDQSIKGYLRGFDSFREVNDDMVQTSAHFLVGEADPYSQAARDGERIAILQTQQADRDGTPYVASHIQPLDIQGHLAKRQYFVRALYQLGYNEPTVHSLLQELFDGRHFDPNMRTIAVEITGYDFENPAYWPSDQKIANVLGVAWAVMKRYGIPASSILGHNEIQLGKPDPGKKFMAMIRHLVGLKALTENDEDMKRLVFGQFLGVEGDPYLAVKRYFNFVRDYLVMVGTRQNVYEWEAASKYWFVHDLVSGEGSGILVANEFRPPVYGTVSFDGFTFLEPANHEGVDYYQNVTKKVLLPSQDATAVYTVADGLCLYAGDSGSCCQGKTAIFRHRQPDGAQVLSVLGHLSRLGDVQAGVRYPVGYKIGEVDHTFAHIEPFMHFAMAYGATWDSDLNLKPTIPLNAGPVWIRERYLNPLEYLKDRI